MFSRIAISILSVAAGFDQFLQNILHVLLVSHGSSPFFLNEFFWMAERDSGFAENAPQAEVKLFAPVSGQQPVDSELGRRAYEYFSVRYCRDRKLYRRARKVARSRLVAVVEFGRNIGSQIGVQHCIASRDSLQDRKSTR